ncbi:MAG TPA: phosphatase PAP2 family protein [Solirubrobacterales bacterium]|nr:phosphatase PAP2 family protein [Solirubrobacterales bacterium]
MESGTITEPRAESATTVPGRDTRRRNALIGLGAYIAATVALISFTGILLARESIFLWLLVGVLAVSFADVRGFARGVIFDWLPFYVILVAYDLLRGYVGHSPLFEPYFLPQIDADRLLFGDTVPTVWLQERLYEVGQLPWYDFASWAVYLTHYFVVFVVAAYLWRVSRPRFLEFRAMVLTLSIAAFLTYALVPAAPPWMASDHGLIGSVARVPGSVWTELGVAPAASIWDKGTSLYNPVAALPSLHAAFPMLLLCVFWRSGTPARALGIAYVLAMGWTLVYGGEHYVFDVLLGWTYAVAVYFGVRWVRARWSDRRARAPAAAAAGTAEAPVRAP